MDFYPLVDNVKIYIRSGLKPILLKCVYVLFDAPL